MRGLRWSFCAFIVYASGEAFAQAMSGHGEHGHSALALAALSGAEIVAALALLIPRLELVAAAALLAIFAIAAALTVAAGEAPLRFAYYAATAVAICAGARAPTPIAT